MRPTQTHKGRREVLAAHASRIIGCHETTIYRWVAETIGGDPGARLCYVRRDAMGHYWLDAEEVRRIAS